MIGAPRRTRTFNLRFTSASLFPVELRRHWDQRRRLSTGLEEKRMSGLSWLAALLESSLLQLLSEPTQVGNRPSAMSTTTQDVRQRPYE